MKIILPLGTPKYFEFKKNEIRLQIGWKKNINKVHLWVLWEKIGNACSEIWNHSNGSKIDDTTWLLTSDNDNYYYNSWLLLL